MTNNPLSAVPENDDIQEWECPYCNQTRQTLSDLRDHITESSQEEHQGVDGLKPTRDLIAYGPNGEVVERVEGISTEPPDPIGQYDKRTLIINSWLAGDRDVNKKAVEKISGASQQYISRLINQLEDGEIPRETYIEVLDYGLIEELRDRLENYESEDTMDAEIRTAADIVEETPKKRQIIAAHEVAAHKATKKEIAEALDVSYEYTRQIFNDIEDRDPDNWEKLREGDLDEDIPETVKEAVAERLRRAGIKTTDIELDALREDAFSEKMIPESGAVPVQEIVRVRERFELLHEQAEFTDDKEALFVSKKGLEWIDELIEQAE